MAEDRAGRDLRVTEIFLSLQGESTTQGLPTSFIRLTGCPLRCSYCDTAYAFTGGQRMSIEQILSAVTGNGVPQVTVTGGEPLAQAGCPGLLTALCDAGYQVSLETSGALPIEHLDPRVTRVMDLKTPSSGESSRNHHANLTALGARDQIKFVIGDRADYDWAREQISQHQLAQRCELLMLPVFERLTPTQLADWILTDRLPVRLQIQLHKAVWGDSPGR